MARGRRGTHTARFPTLRSSFTKTAAALQGRAALLRGSGGAAAPPCHSSLRRHSINYRFFDLELDFCAEHVFWLDKDEDNRILELMRGEEKRIENTVR